MRVNYLFVIGIVPKSPAGMGEADVRKDTLACVDAIFDRHKAKCKSVASYAYEYVGGFQSFLEWSVDDKSYMPDFAPEHGQLRHIDNWFNGLVPYGYRVDEVASAIQPNELVGVYLIANYERKTGVLESMMVEAVAGMLASLGLPRIDKLCLISCGAGRVGTKDKQNKMSAEKLNASGTAAQNANEVCFVYQLCCHLQQHGYAPMIAGWDGYVDVVLDRGVDYGRKKKFDTKKDKDSLKRVIQFSGVRPTWHLATTGWSETRMAE